MATSTPRPDLAKKIEEWLEASGVKEPATETREFIADLRQGQNIKQWAGVDYPRILPPRFRDSKTVAVLTFLRNVIVFLPIGLTWLALKEASESFSEAVAVLRTSGADAQVNFLEHWQAIEGWSRFSTVAAVDVALIVAVVVLTAVIGAYDALSGRQQRLEQQHAGLMTALERGLNEFRYLTAAEIGSALSGTMSSLLNATQNIEVGAAALQKAGSDAFAAVDNVRQTTSTSFEPLLQQLQQTIDQLGPAVQAHASMASLVASSQQQFASQLDATRVGFQAIVGSVDAESRRMVAAVETGLLNAAAGIEAAARTVSTDLARQTVDAVTGLGQEVRNTTTALDASLQGVAHVFEAASAKLTQTMATVEYGIQQIRNDLEAMRGSLGGPQ